VLRREYDVHVVWPAGRVPSRWTPPDETTRRIEYAGRQTADSAGLRALKEPAAAGEIRRIDAALLRRCRWRDEVVRATGSAREFLGHGIGFCLLVDGMVVSEAYACFWGRERLEIATITHPEHRGRGYAGAVCAHLIESCEGLGFATYWSCDAANRASCKLASKLGFADPQRYRLLVYRQRTAR
jgi:RimJ/RimL family protein N-acetyltransferase